MSAEMSAPRVLRGTNAVALDRTLAVDLIDAAMTELGRQLPDVPRIDDVELLRCDLPSDIVTTTPIHVILPILAARYVPRATVNELRSNFGQPQTWTVGSPTQWSVRAYDKSRHLLWLASRQGADAAPLRNWSDAVKGTLRIEVEVRRPLLRKTGLTKVTDLSPAAIERLSELLSTRARVHQPYGSEVLTEQLIELGKTESPADFRNVMSLLAAEAFGVSVPMSKRPRQRALAIVRREGLHAAHVEGPRRFLDVLSSQEITSP